LGHAVAFPDVGVRETRGRIDLGPDAPLELVLDQSDLASADGARAAVDRAFDYWLGDRRRGQALSSRQLELIEELWRRRSSCGRCCAGRWRPAKPRWCG
jgi:hypothetical protein